MSPRPPHGSSSPWSHWFAQGEKAIAKDSWRSPGQTHREYLNQLVTWGYAPSEVEQIILDSAKPAEDDAAE